MTHFEVEKGVRHHAATVTNPFLGECDRIVVVEAWIDGDSRENQNIGGCRGGWKATAGRSRSYPKLEWLACKIEIRRIQREFDARWLDFNDDVVRVTLFDVSGLHLVAIFRERFFYFQFPRG